MQAPTRTLAMTDNTDEHQHAREAVTHAHNAQPRAERASATRALPLCGHRHTSGAHATRGEVAGRPLWGHSGLIEWRDTLGWT